MIIELFYVQDTTTEQVVQGDKMPSTVKHQVSFHLPHIPHEMTGCIVIDFVRSIA